jgi:hypothetical protein
MRISFIILLWYSNLILKNISASNNLPTCIFTSCTFASKCTDYFIVDGSALHVQIIMLF